MYCAKWFFFFFFNPGKYIGVINLNTKYKVLFKKSTRWITNHNSGKAKSFFKAIVFIIHWRYYDSSSLMADLESGACAITFLGDIFHAPLHYKQFLTPEWIGFRGCEESFLRGPAAPLPFHTCALPLLTAPRTCSMVTATPVSLQKPQRIYPCWSKSLSFEVAQRFYTRVKWQRWGNS